MRVFPYTICIIIATCIIPDYALCICIRIYTLEAGRGFALPAAIAMYKKPPRQGGRYEKKIQ